MKKRVAVIGLLMVVTGIALLIAGGFAMGFDFRKLDNHDYIERSVEITDAFDSISFEGGKIRILPSEDGKCRAVFTESGKIRYTSEIENDMLTIKRVDDRKWYEYIGFHFKDYGAVLYLPEVKYNSLFLKSLSGSIEVAEGLTFHHVNIDSTSGSIRCHAKIDDNLFAESKSGSVEISGANARSISVSSTSGSLKLYDMDVAGAIGVYKTSGSIHADNVRCESMEIHSTSGSTKLDSVIVSGEMKIKSSSGSIRFDGSDAGSFRIESTSGSIKGTLLSEKDFDVHTTSGSIDVPSSVEGSGVFSAYVTSGSVDIRIK